GGGKHPLRAATGGSQNRRVDQILRRCSSMRGLRPTADHFVPSDFTLARVRDELVGRGTKGLLCLASCFPRHLLSRPLTPSPIARQIPRGKSSHSLTTSSTPNPGQALGDRCSTMVASTLRWVPCRPIGERTVSG